MVSQCNNVYVFPGIGLGACAVKARRISDGMLRAAVQAVGAYPLAEGRLLPPSNRWGGGPRRGEGGGTLCPCRGAGRFRRRSRTFD